MKLSEKQRKAIASEINVWLVVAKLGMDNPDQLENDAAHRAVVEAIKLVKVLLGEMTLDEYVATIVEEDLKDHYNFVFGP